MRKCRSHLITLTAVLALLLTGNIAQGTFPERTARLSSSAINRERGNCTRSTPMEAGWHRSHSYRLPHGNCGYLSSHPMGVGYSSLTTRLRTRAKRIRFPQSVALTSM